MVKRVFMSLSHIVSESCESNQMLLLEWFYLDIILFLYRLNHLLCCFPSSGIKAMIVVTDYQFHDGSRAYIKLCIRLIQGGQYIVVYRIQVCSHIYKYICIQKKSHFSEHEVRVVHDKGPLVLPKGLYIFVT